MDFRLTDGIEFREKLALGSRVSFICVTTAKADQISSTDCLQTVLIIKAVKCLIVLEVCSCMLLSKTFQLKLRPGMLRRELSFVRLVRL